MLCLETTPRTDTIQVTPMGYNCSLAGISVSTSLQSVMDVQYYVTVVVLSRTKSSIYYLNFQLSFIYHDMIRSCLDICLDRTLTSLGSCQAC